MGFDLISTQYLLRLRTVCRSCFFFGGSFKNRINVVCILPQWVAGRKHYIRFTLNFSRSVLHLPGRLVSSGGARCSEAILPAAPVSTIFHFYGLIFCPPRLLLSAD